MKKTTVHANPGRSVPLSATCIRVDNGPRIITADQGDVELELRDLVAVQYIRRSVKRGDLDEVKTIAPRALAPGEQLAEGTPPPGVTVGPRITAPTGRKD